MQHEPVGTITGAENAYQYNGKELNSDFDLDWLDYGARWYDASIARWSAVDPLSEKYYSISPYAYVANNPLKYIDPDGRQIDVGDLKGKAKVNDNGEEKQVNIQQELIKSLEEITGLYLSIDENGMMQYEPLRENGEIVLDENGNPIPKVRTKTKGKRKPKEVEIGSSTARSILTGAINDDETIVVRNTINKGSGVDMENEENGNNLDFDIQQTTDFMNNVSSSLNPNSQGHGMTFFHEILHTKVGGRLEDAYSYDTGGEVVVDIINKIRSDLGDYGSRKTYLQIYIPSTKTNYIPYDQSSYDRLKRGMAPSSSSKYLMHSKLE